MTPRWRGSIVQASQFRANKTNLLKDQHPRASRGPSSRCGAKTRSGVSCAKFPIKGKRRCRLYGGLSAGPRTPAGRAAISAANTNTGATKTGVRGRLKSGITDEKSNG